jgi:hypothetical protein
MPWVRGTKGGEYGGMRFDAKRKSEAKPDGS